MNHNVWEAIEQFHLIQQGDRVCAALSGGADSVALTHFLWENQKKLGIQLSACHVNHCLRKCGWWMWQPYPARMDSPRRNAAAGSGTVFLRN